MRFDSETGDDVRFMRHMHDVLREKLLEGLRGSAGVTVVVQRGLLDGRGGQPTGATAFDQSVVEGFAMLAVDLVDETPVLLALRALTVRAFRRRFA